MVTTERRVIPRLTWLTPPERLDEEYRLELECEVPYPNIRGCETAYYEHGVFRNGAIGRHDAVRAKDLMLPTVYQNGCEEISDLFGPVSYCWPHQSRQVTIVVHEVPASLIRPEPSLLARLNELFSF